MDATKKANGHGMARTNDYGIPVGDDMFRGVTVALRVISAILSSEARTLQSFLPRTSSKPLLPLPLPASLPVSPPPLKRASTDPLELPVARQDTHRDIHMRQQKKESGKGRGRVGEERGRRRRSRV